MDWYSWLLKTGLEPSVVNNYAIIFNQNELEEDDLVYFNHEMLQSMGICIAKHRLEILKMIKEKLNNIHHPIWWLIVAVKQTKRYVSKQVQELVKNRKSSSLSIVPKQSLAMHSARWKVAMLKRNKNYISAKQENIPLPIISYGSSPVVRSQKVLMLTNGSPLVEHHHSWNSNASSPPMVYMFRMSFQWFISSSIPSNGIGGLEAFEHHHSRYWKQTDSRYFRYDKKAGMMEDDVEHWETDVVPVEDMRWDAMFQDLKPT